MITWENIGLTNGWSVRSGSYAARAGITDDQSFIAVAGEITHSPVSGKSTIGLLPVKAPAKAQDVPVVVTTTNNAVASAALYVDATGGLTLFGLPASTEIVAFSVLIPAA